MTAAEPGDPVVVIGRQFGFAPGTRGRVVRINPVQGHPEVSIDGVRGQAFVFHPWNIKPADAPKQEGR